MAEANPDLVVRDEKGEVHRALGRGERECCSHQFLKEHHKVEEQQPTITQLKSAVAKQEATIAQQQRVMDAVTPGLDG